MERLKICKLLKMSSELSKKKRKQDNTEASRKNPKKKKNAPEGEDEFVVRWQNPALQADLVVEKLRTLNSTMSSIELGERSIPAFIDTASWEKPERNAEDLPEFLQQDFDFSMPTNSPGSPHTLVLSPAALRVADLTRALKKFKSHGKAEIAKLFARHFKLSEHIEYVRKTPINIAVGTPGRIVGLVEAEDALKLEKLRYLVIDANYIDSKKRTIFDIPETVRDTITVLTNPEIRKRIAADKLKVVFY